jgi:hypothetical protein
VLEDHFSAGHRAAVVKSQEAEAYANYFLFTAEDLMTDIIQAMSPRPELLYIYTQMDYEQQEGSHKPTKVPEMILQVRLRLQHGIPTSAGPQTVQKIHDRLGMTAPLFSVAWMVNRIKLEMMGSQASHSNPPHGIFYSKPGGPKPIPHVVIRDISANYHRRAILDTLPAEVLRAMAGYVWIAGDTPGYPNWTRDPTRHALVIYCLPAIGSADPSVWLPTPTLIELGHGMYTPARQEMGDDVVHMGRLRSRSHRTQPGPIQIHQVIDTEGKGAPITAWTGGGSLRSLASTSGGSRGTASASATGRSSHGPQNASLSYSTLIAQAPARTTYQQSPSPDLMGSSSMGRFDSSPMDTTDGSQGINSNVSMGQGFGQAAHAHTTDEVAILTAQLTEAMTAVRSLQQQNRELGSFNADMALQMRDMRAQIQEERAEMRRLLIGCGVLQSSSPKRQREETEVTRSDAPAPTTENARTGNEGLQGQMRDEDDVEEDEVFFTNQTGTRYPPKPHYTNASAQTDRSVGQRQKYAHLFLADRVDYILQDRRGDQAIRASTNKGIRKGWDPGPPVWDPGIPIGHMRTNQTIVLDTVERIWHPTVHSGWLVGTQWDPGPPWEAQNKPLEYKQRLTQEGGDAAGMTANNQASTEKEWKAPAVKMRRSGRLDRYVETFSIRLTTPENRPEQTNHKQSILRLHWLTHQRKGGGHGDGTLGGRWAVSTDGGWTQKPSIVDRERHTAIRGQPWHTVDSLWQNWGSLEGGGNLGHTAEPDNQMEKHGPREEGSLIQPPSSTQGHTATGPQKRSRTGNTGKPKT